MATPFHVELVTPERVLFAGEADEVSMRTVEGEITFLARHEDYIGVADVTVVRIGFSGGTADDGTEREPSETRAAVHGGFVHVGRDGVVILAGVAELASEIDVARARAALQAAEARRDAGAEPTARRVETPDSEATPERPTPEAALALALSDSPEAAIRRAKVRLEAAGATASA
jgi:F-type H+-transporting ATPase subunit epsilon